MYDVCFVYDRSNHSAMTFMTTHAALTDFSIVHCKASGIAAENKGFDCSGAH